MWAAAEEMTRIYISIRRLSSFCNEKKKKKLLHAAVFFLLFLSDLILLGTK